MNKIGLLFAMEEEAKSYKEWLSDRNGMLGNCSARVYTFGIGKNNAAIGLVRAIADGCDIIVNIGTCGSTMKSKDKVFVPTHFYDGDFDLSAFGNMTKDPCSVNSSEPDENSVVLYSYSRFVTDSPENRIVDMEAYIIKAMTKEMNIPSYFFKIVSDEANGEHTEDFDNVAEEVCLSVVDTVMMKLKNMVCRGEENAQISFF